MFAFLLPVYALTGSAHRVQFNNDFRALQSCDMIGNKDSTHVDDAAVQTASHERSSAPARIA